jgi:hypothetical protein
MNEDQSILYSDGKNVMVTSSELVVDGARYLLKSMKEVRLHFIRHYKFPPLTFILVGVISVIVGISGLMDNMRLEEIYIGNFLVTPDRLFIIVGTIVTLLGLLWLSILQNKYILVISTNDGGWNSIPLALGRQKNELNTIVKVISNAIDKFQN